jgi:predicted enzyme related to lactoylglutathione lyase
MLSFYRDTLGFDVPYSADGEFAFLRMSRDREPEIALYPGRASNQGGDNHWFVVIDVDDIERAVAGLQERGVAVGAIEDVPYGRAATFRDPEGNIIEVHEPGRAPS